MSPAPHSNLSYAVAQTLSDAFSREEYERLLERTPLKTVFDSWAWVSACYDAPNTEPLIVTARNANNQLVCVAPLKRERRTIAGVPTSILCLVQHPYGDQMTLPHDPNEPAAPGKLIEFLYNSVIAFDAIMLDEIRCTTVDGLDIDNCLPTFIHRHELRRTPVVLFDGEDANAHKAHYSKSLKRKLQRCRNKLAKQNAKIEIDHLNADEVADTLVELKSIEDESWKGTDQLGIFSTPDRFDLFKAISERAAKAGHLIVGRIRVAGEAITYRYGFSYGGVVYDYNLAFDPAYSQLGAGRLLLDEMILQAANEKATAFDGSRTGRTTTNLLVERDPIWIPHERWMAFRTTPAGMWAQLFLTQIKPTARRLKSRLKRGQPTV